MMIREFVLFIIFLHLNFIDCHSIPFDQIVVFGDSNSDYGNVFRLTKGRWPPTPPFYQGRFSNGPMWTDQLDLVQIINYAYGSATTDDHLVQGVTTLNRSVPGVRQQIEMYRKRHQSNFDRTLFIIWVGANDYFFNMNLTAKQVVFSLINDIQQLISFGGKHILVMNQPPIDQIPIAKLTNKTEKWKSIVLKHNEYLTQWIQWLNESYSNVLINIIDIYSFVRYILSNMNQLALTNVDGCWKTKNETMIEHCQISDSHIYLDEFHFTTRIHQLIADFIRKTLLRLYEHL